MNICWHIYCGIMLAIHQVFNEKIDYQINIEEYIYTSYDTRYSK